MTEYFLHVDVQVLASESTSYEEKLATFIAGNEKGKAFQRVDPAADYALVLGLKSTEQFIPQYSILGRFSATSTVPSDPSQRVQCKAQGLALSQEVVRYVNLWSVPDLQDLDLARIMKRLSDDTHYLAVHRLVRFEEQDFVMRVRFGPPEQLGAGKSFVRTVKTFESKDIGTYLFDSGILRQALAFVGWNHLGYYQSVTGRLNQVVEFWQTGEQYPSPSSMLVAAEKANAAGVANKVLGPASGSLEDVWETFEWASFFDGQAGMGKT